MKTLFEPVVVDEVMGRLDTLTPESKALWGKMTVAQAVAHCCISMQTAVGDHRPKQMWIGRLIGPLVLKPFLGEKPIRRNSPTDVTFLVMDQRDLDVERERLKGLIRRFHAGGAKECSAHPHSFFGKMTPEQWARLMYRHLDHHLKQFGV